MGNEDAASRGRDIPAIDRAWKLLHRKLNG